MKSLRCRINNSNQNTGHTILYLEGITGKLLLCHTWHAQLHVLVLCIITSG